MKHPIAVGSTALVSFVALAATAGCGAVSDQEITGQVGTGWDSPPTVVIATSIESGEAPGPVAERSRVTSDAPIREDGRFALTLEGQRIYLVDVIQQDGSRVAIMFPTDDGRASRTLRVHGGAPSFDMGPLDLHAPFDSATYEPPVVSTDATVGTTKLALELSGGPDAGSTGTGDDGTGAVSPAAGGDDEDEDSDSDSEDGVCEEDVEDGDSGAEVQADEAGIPTNVPPQGIGSCDDDSSSDSDSDSDD